MTIYEPEHNNVYAFIQARCNSRRLPGKVMKPLLGKKLLSWVVERALMIHPDVQVVVITGDIKENIPIINWCHDNDIECFLGSEDNVLNRYNAAATTFGADTVIRLTADNPLFDYVGAHTLLAVHLLDKAEYCSNKTEIGSKLPVGIGVEIFSTDTLMRLDGMSLSKSHREHVSDYILEHPDQFHQCFWLSIPQDFSKYRFTIDTKADFDRIRRWMTTIFPEKVHEPDYWKGIVENCQRTDK